MDGSVFEWGWADTMEYQILRNTVLNLELGLVQMETLVNRAMSEGWTIAGSLGVTTHGDERLFHTLMQPMTRVRPLPGNNRTTILNNINRVLR